MAHRRILTLAAVAAGLLLAGCAGYRGGHGGGPGTGHGAGMGMHQHDGQPMDRMCGMHREMTAGRTPAEQQAAIEAHIRSMHGTVTAEMVEQHRRMMESRCGGAAAAPAAK